MTKSEKIFYSRTGHKWQYGACALHAGYIILHIDTQVVQYLLGFHWNNGCIKAPQCYVVRTLPVLLKSAVFKIVQPVSLLCHYKREDCPLHRGLHLPCKMSGLFGGETDLFSTIKIEPYFSSNPPHFLTYIELICFVHQCFAHMCVCVYVCVCEGGDSISISS